MSKNIKYKINLIEFRDLKKRKYFVVTGWCYSLDAYKMIKYRVQINKKDINIKLTRPDRKDLLKKFDLSYKNSNLGFVIEAETVEEPTELLVEAIIDDNVIPIVSLDKKHIQKYRNSKEINYHIDSFEYDEETNSYECTGWAYSFEKSPITFDILDSRGIKIESNYKALRRLDLITLSFVQYDQKMSGFKITFNGEKKLKYQLQMICDSQVIKVPLSLKHINERRNTILSYLSAINLSRIHDGYRYLKKNGLGQFIHRLASGPNDRWVKYNSWFEKNKVTAEEMEVQRKTVFSYNPKISIIVATFNTAENYLKEMIDSVIFQTYSNWELCIADGSTNDYVEKYIKNHYADEKRIKFKKLEKNFGISGNMNGALELVTGDFVGLFDHDDLLTLDALYEIVSSMQVERHDVIYTDEDKLNDKTKKFEDPHFKPDFSIDLLRAHNYITHFFVVDMNIVNKVGGLRSEYDGSQDHDFIFRCVEQAQSIHHIPKILYHWRMHPLSTAMDPESKMYCYVSGQKAIESHLKRMNIKAHVEMLPRPLYGMYHTKYLVEGNPLVSILIPNMNNKQLLQKCVDSLFVINSYKNIEIVIVENNSNENEIFEYYDSLQKEHENVKVVTWKGEFNYSAINNFGVNFTSGNYILFLNNDTQVIDPDSIEEMLGCCMRDDVGVVGAKLLYEDDTVQHCGVVVGYKGYATAAFSLIGKDDFGYMGRPRVTSDFSAVTAACMMVKKKDFYAVNGFDEQFKVACNDVDFCLKIRSTNKLVVEDVFSLWYHFESKTRGLEDTPEKLERFHNEIDKFQKKWPEILEKGDPFHNINFNLDEGPFTYPE